MCFASFAETWLVNTPGYTLKSEHNIFFILLEDCSQKTSSHHMHVWCDGCMGHTVYPRTYEGPTQIMHANPIPTSPTCNLYGAHI